MLRPSRLTVPPRLLLLLTLAGAASACGRGLTDLTAEAMAACIEVRNPLFAQGEGARALDVPLPANAEDIAQRLRYPRASQTLQKIAKAAPDQVTLVCALDLMSRWQDREPRAFIARYQAHPDAPVAEAARRLAPPAGR